MQHWAHKTQEEDKQNRKHNICKDHPIYTACVSSVNEFNPEDHLSFLIHTTITDFVKDHDYTCTCWCNKGCSFLYIFLVKNNVLWWWPYLISTQHVHYIDSIHLKIDFR